MKKILLVCLLLCGFFTRSFGSVSFFDGFGYTAEVYVERTYSSNGSWISVGAFSPGSEILTYDMPQGGSIELGDSNAYLGHYLDGDTWYFNIYESYYYSLVNVTYHEPEGGGSNGGGGNGTPAVSFTSSTTDAQVGQTVWFQVAASCGWGLNEIGLEGCNSAGIAEINLGAFGVSGTSANREFSWTASQPGTFHFDSYGWNSDRSQLTRTAVITVVVVGENGSATPTVTFTSSTTNAQVGQTITFQVSANCGAGLNEIGLEGCDSSGNAVVNLGIFSPDGSTANRDFTWTASQPGVYYFDSYAWNFNRTQLIRTGVIAVNVTAAGTGNGTSNGTGHPVNPHDVIDAAETITSLAELPDTLNDLKKDLLKFSKAVNGRRPPTTLMGAVRMGIQAAQLAKDGHDVGQLAEEIANGAITVDQMFKGEGYELEPLTFGSLADDAIDLGVAAWPFLVGAGAATGISEALFLVYATGHLVLDYEQAVANAVGPLLQATGKTIYDGAQNAILSEPQEQPFWQIWFQNLFSLAPVLFRPL